MKESLNNSKHFIDLMSKNIKMLDIKMNDTIPDIKNFTIFSETDT